MLATYVYVCLTLLVTRNATVDCFDWTWYWSVSRGSCPFWCSFGKVRVTNCVQLFCNDCIAGFLRTINKDKAGLGCA